VDGGRAFAACLSPCWRAAAATAARRLLRVHSTSPISARGLCAGAAARVFYPSLWRRSRAAGGRAPSAARSLCPLKIALRAFLPPLPGFPPASPLPSSRRLALALGSASAHRERVGMAATAGGFGWRSIARMTPRLWNPDISACGCCDFRQAGTKTSYLSRRRSCGAENAWLAGGRGPGVLATRASSRRPLISHLAAYSHSLLPLWNAPHGCQRHALRTHRAFYAWTSLISRPPPLTLHGDPAFGERLRANSASA